MLINMQIICVEGKSQYYGQIDLIMPNNEGKSFNNYPQKEIDSSSISCNSSIYNDKEGDGNLISQEGDGDFIAFINNFCNNYNENNEKKMLENEFSSTLTEHKKSNKNNWERNEHNLTGIHETLNIKEISPENNKPNNK
jgi:hypothetical protein